MTQALLSPPAAPVAAVPLVPSSAMSPTPSPAEDRTAGVVLLRNISWKTYCSLLEELGDSPIHMTYDRGVLEIEMPSRRHEQIKSFVGQLVSATLVHAGVDFEPAGSATWQREDLSRGLEADECYHIQHAAEVRGKVELDLAVDPPPDLVIEIDLSPTTLSKMDIYRKLEVPEIWRVRADETIEMTLADVVGQYRPIAVSKAVPQLSADIVARYVQLRKELGHSAALCRFNAEVLSQ